MSKTCVPFHEITSQNQPFRESDIPLHPEKHRKTATLTSAGRATSVNERDATLQHGYSLESLLIVLQLTKYL